MDTKENPEPISAQIEALDDIYREYIDEKLSPAKKYEKVKEILSTAHRNGVVEGKRECVLAMKKYFDEIDEEDWKSWEVSSKLSLLGEN